MQAIRQRRCGGGRTRKFQRIRTRALGCCPAWVQGFIRRLSGTISYSLALAPDGAAHATSEGERQIVFWVKYEKMRRFGLGGPTHARGMRRGVNKVPNSDVEG